MIYERPNNYGLSKSIIEGVTQILENYESIIVLEDDMVTSPFFLIYMQDGLDFFKKNDAVISIHGYSYPTKEVLPDAFFKRC